MNIRTRIAPSPTGPFHIGTARTALFNWLYAKKNGGTFFIRVEDTDRARSKKEYEKDIVSQLDWLGLTPDETYRQSELLGSHIEAIKKLLDSDKAYISKEKSHDNPNRIVEVVRLRNPNTTITFHDLIRGDVTFDTTELGDFVIARAIDDPLFHLVVVVDDAAMGTTHVMRGEDHISNTQRHILIQRALGVETPQYAHLPLILAPDKSKLSKRRHMALVSQYRETGYLPEAVINFLALLGWSPGDDREIFSPEELVEAFDISQIQKSGAVFNVEKLRWFNREYLLKMDEDEFARECMDRLGKTFSCPAGKEGVLPKLVPVIKERISVWSDIDEMARGGEFDFYFEQPEIDVKKLAWKKSSLEETQKHLQAVREILSKLDEKDFDNAEIVKEALWPYAEEHGKGDVLWPLRYALTGRDKSPDPFTVASILNKTEALARLDKIFI